MCVQPKVRAVAARIFQPKAAKAAKAASIVLAATLTGCGNTLTLQSVDGPRPTLGLVVDPAAPTHVESGDNQMLELAQVIDIGEGAEVIKGQISSAGDVDVYDLGPMAEGDRIRVDVSAEAGLSAAIGLFDDSGCALLINDHRNVYMGRQGPFLDVTIRRPSNSCLVALTATPGFEANGAYELSAAIEFPAPLPAPRQDVFVLDFEGGNAVRVGARPAVNIPPFDAANVSRSFDGLTSQMIDEIVARVRQHFEGYNITILSSKESDGADTASRVYFGTFDPALLGVAEGVDEYNLVQAQHAIVFADTFEVFEPLVPTLEELSQAMANVASHEIGHLLGLVHSSDPEDIMDVTANLEQLMKVQFFGRAPIYDLVFPLGDQNSAQMLLDAVGGEESLRQTAAALKPRLQSQGPRDGQPAVRDLRILAGCGLGGH